MEAENKNLKKIFYFFIVLHVCLWAFLPLLRAILPIDALEGIQWGSMLDFGTNKHPPLASWISYSIYHVFQTDFSIYLLGQMFIALGFIYMYKLAKFFLDETYAILSVMIMEGCFVYSYMSIYDGFNPNFVLLGLLPFVTYEFYKSITFNRKHNWLFLGFGAGFCLLDKYQSILVFISMFLYLCFFKREVFKLKRFYIAALIAILMFLPHIIWLYDNNFFPLQYFVECEQKYSAYYPPILRYIVSPVVFLANQIFALAGTLFIFILAHLIFKEPFKLNKNKEGMFLVFVGLLPLFLQAIPGLITGNHIINVWGYPLLFMAGIMLFYFFPIKNNEKITKFITNFVFFAMFVIFVVLTIVFTTERNFANRFESYNVANQLKEIYLKETNRPLKYLGGFIELTIPLNIYNNDFNVVLDTYGHKNPWINQDDLKKNGAMVIHRHPNQMLTFIQRNFPWNKQMIEFKEFSFKVKSVIGRERTYKMYYYIVPPEIGY